MTDRIIIIEKMRIHTSAQIQQETALGGMHAVATGLSGKILGGKWAVIDGSFVRF